MAALPKEPRQRMINIMYLVLTALLALNVSSEVLTAFRTVNQSLENSNALIDDKDNTIFKSLAEKLKDPKTIQLAQVWAPKADKARELSEGIITYINGISNQVKTASGFDPAKGEESFDESNLDAPTRILVDQKEGDKLYQKLKDYHDAMLAIDPKIAAQFSKTLPLSLAIPKVEDKSNKSWASAYFNMTPAVAAVTILTKFKNDVKNSESQVVEFCHNQIGQIQVVYDQFQAIATASANYLMPGQALSIYAGVGAFSAAAKPSITIDGASVPLGPDGMAEFKTTAGGPGTYTKRVNISFVKPDGSTASLVKDIQYTVGAPSGASVSADAVKVLYVGLNNPITVTGGGGKGAEATKVSIDNGSLSSTGNGHYDVTVSRAGTATINVTTDGKTIPFQFRVKNVPDPIAMVGASKGGRIATNAFKGQQGVRAELENFVFEGVNFHVTGYTITFTGAGYPEFKYQQVNGNSFGPARSLIEQARPGSTITIDEIRADGPGGTRRLPPIAFNLY
ncbi:type IX secretion system motor protein PorM/GldM [Rhizosphaericola mali]|uniref:Gliding motility protein GldM n=1 Tax=Rhizosphaericola mali TaxID=2545455 RepID=A0A5P2G567_9BACT|nr:gliding motility protein GldM [Rhizosphaericola mali]QES90665.1 gliding motility protein GldM [Rhizosphaericola mali]